MTRFLAGIFMVALFSSCMVQRGFYLSPLNSQAFPYHTIPYKTDSFKSAFYAGAVFSTGSANDRGRDWVNAFQASIYRSHNLGNVDVYYGGNINLGNYHITNFYNAHYDQNDFPIDTFYHIPSDKYFFGSYGLNGGINGVMRTRRGEWRWLGFEASLQKEFGDYNSFRKNLPDTAANIIFKNDLTGTIGLYTEVIWKNKHNSKFGFKFELSMLVNPRNEYTRLNTYSIYPISFFSNTFHMTVGHFTGFIQGNFGTKTSTFQIGTSYRIGKK